MVMTNGLRLCVLKREEKESFDFLLQQEKHNRGHIIRDVESKGIAQRSGLQDGDRLLEVNNFYVEDISHSEVVRKMNQSGNQLCLLVLDEKTYKQAVFQDQDLRGMARAWRAGCEPPRLCHISRDSVSGLGVNFIALEGSNSRGEKGRFSVSLLAGGAADKAGVRKGDRLVWMDGAMVSDLTHSALSRMMKKCGDITILVIDGESEKKYMQKKMPILPSMAIPLNLPHRARKFHLECGPDDFGFELHLDTTASGRAYHFLRAVERGSKAEKGGMKNEELLLEVNEESVENLEHEEVVDRMKMSWKQVSLTTISPQGLDFYSKLGLSPLLFCEDIAEDENEIPTHARLCYLQKGPAGFGFNLGRFHRRTGAFVTKVVSGSPAENAGLTEGDAVIEVNGRNIERKKLEDVLVLTKGEGAFLSLLVMDEMNYRYQRSNSPSTYTLVYEDEELTIL
ncbi:unnamed protein product [Ophioblennius macclurei]